MAKARDKDMRTFAQATQGMSFGGKVGYIWEYYRLHIIGSIAGFALIFSMIHAFVTNQDQYLNITTLSGFAHTAQLMNPEEAPASVDDNPLFDLGPPGIGLDFELANTLEALLFEDGYKSGYEIVVNHLQINFETISVLMTHAGAGALDLLVTYPDDLEAMIGAYHFHNIRELGWDLPEEAFYNDFGLYLSYFPIFDDYIWGAPGAGDLIMGISTGSRNLENIQNALYAFLAQ